MPRLPFNDASVLALTDCRERFSPIFCQTSCSAMSGRCPSIVRLTSWQRSAVSSTTIQLVRWCRLTTPTTSKLKTQL